MILPHARHMLALAALAAAFPGSIAAGAELLTNGSFELPVIATIDQEYSAPSDAIVGWQLTERTININRNSAIFGTAHSGEQMVDINGSDNGTLRQSFPTTVGGTYLLSLYYANNPNPSLASPVYEADVMLLGATTLYDQFLTHAGSTAADMKWTPLSHPFIANSTTTILQLRSRMLGFNGVVFDSVSVTTIPEPATFLLVAIKMTLLVTFCRRRL